MRVIFTQRIAAARAEFFYRVGHGQILKNLGKPRKLPFKKHSPPSALPHRTVFKLKYNLSRNTVEYSVLFQKGKGDRPYIDTRRSRTITQKRKGLPV